MRFFKIEVEWRTRVRGVPLVIFLLLSKMAISSPLLVEARLLSILSDMFLSSVSWIQAPAPDIISPFSVRLQEPWTNIVVGLSESSGEGGICFAGIGWFVVLDENTLKPLLRVVRSVEGSKVIDSFARNAAMLASFCWGVRGGE